MRAGWASHFLDKTFQSYVQGSGLKHQQNIINQNIHLKIQEQIFFS